MEIHKPHAAKTWKEFVIELGTIVLGILIALGLEQSVEAIHEGRVAAEARAAVRAEVRENLFWLEQREQIEPCVTRRLADLNQLLVHARRGDAVPVIQHVGDFGHAKVTTLRWEANSQAGRASLFSEDEQRVLGNMYYTTEQFSGLQEQEEVTWSKMRFIQGLSPLVPLDVHDLSIFLAEARHQNARVFLNIHRAHQWAERMHLTAENPAGVEGKARVRQAPICLPLVPNSNFFKPDARTSPEDLY